MLKYYLQLVVCLCVCALGIPSAWAEETTLDFSKIEGFKNWGNGYTNHTVSYDKDTVYFSNASKQGGTITDIPVCKGGYVEFKLDEKKGALTALVLKGRQWSNKSQTIKLEYSTDGGKKYTSTKATWSNYTLTAASLPENTNAVKFTFGNNGNQVGIESLKITYGADNREVVDITSFEAEKTTINLFETLETTVKNSSENWTGAYVYTSSNTSVATVDENGKITGKAAGTADIIVVADINNDKDYKAGKADTLKITVEDNRAVVNLNSFTAAKTNLVKNETTSTTVSNNQSGWKASYTYTSDKESVATVNAEGVITAVSKGNANIKVTANVASDDKKFKAGTVSLTLAINVTNPTHKAQFSVNGTIATSTDVEEGAAIVFNDPTSIPEGQTFMGWTNAALTGTQESAPTYVTSATMGDKDVTFFAVFAKASTSAEDAKWKKLSYEDVLADPKEGVYALITSDGYAFNGTISSGKGQITKTAFSFDEKNNIPEGVCELTITKKVNGGIEIYNKDHGYLIATKAKSGNLSWNTSSQSYWLKKNNNLSYKDNEAVLRVFQNQFNTYKYQNNNLNGVVPEFAYRPGVTYSNYCTTVGGEVDNREFVNLASWATTTGAVTLTKGQKLATVATLTPAACKTATFAYTSSDEKVATINNEGVITAVSKGTATLKVVISLDEKDENYRIGGTTEKTLDIEVLNPLHTVTFLANGTEVESNEVREEEAIVFPAVTAPTGLVFAGWAAQDWEGMQYTEPAWVNTTATVMGETGLEFVAVFARVAQKGTEVKYSLTEEQIQEHFTQTAQAYGDEERSWNDESVTWRFFGKSEKNGTYLQINSTSKESYIAFNSQNYITNIAFNILNGSSREYENSLYIYDATTGSSVTTVNLNKVKEASIAIEGNHKNLSIQSGQAAKISNIVLTCVTPDQYVGYATTEAAANEVHTSQVTIANCDYTTVCLPYNAKVQDGVQAFALRDVDEKGMHFSPVDTLIAGKGYVLQATAGAEVELSEVLEPSLDTINLMSGVVTRTLRESITYQGTGEYAYPWILAKDGTFKRYVGEYIPAGKAYVDGALIQKMKSSAANAFRVIFEDETTGLSQLNEESKAPAYYYNLQGQRVAQPTRSGAIYMERGNRKFIVK